MSKNKTHKTPFGKLAFAFLLLIVSIIAFTYFSYISNKKILYDALDSKLKNACDAGNYIFTDYKINSVGLTELSNKEKAKKGYEISLLNIKFQTDYIYVFYIENNTVIFYISSHNPSNLKDSTILQMGIEYPEASQELLNAFKTGDAFYETTSDRWGEFKSYLMPIKGKDNKYYIIGVDLETRNIHQILQKDLYRTIFGGSFIALMCLPLFLLFYNSKRNYSMLLEQLVNERTLELKKEIQEHESTQLMLRDSITVSEELAEKADNANNAKTNFLSSISHELRTPIHGITGMVDLLESTPLNEEQLKYIESLKDSSGHLLQLINSILCYTEIGNTSLEIKKDSFEIKQQLNDILQLYKGLISDNNIKVDIDISDKLNDVILTENYYLKQILQNIISNAIKFTKKGIVTISVYPDIHKQNISQPFISFSIKDTGIGMSQDNMYKIFDSFYQSEQGTSRRFNGTGIGLSICRKLLNLMNGDIQVKSEIGKGSEFIVTIPLEYYKVEFKNKPLDINALQIDKPILSILVVEDNMINSKVAKNALTKKGHHVEIAENGLLALDMLRTQRFDIVLMDIEMPVMDGIETTKQIRTGNCGKNSPNIPIIAISAHNIERYRSLAMHVGMDLFIAKPVNFNEVENHILEIINKNPNRFSNYS